jgi:hypothetical protein
MKKLFLLVFIAFSVFVSCKKKQENVLQSIRQKQEEINADLSKYTLRQVDDIISAERGIIIGYFRDEEAKKVQSQHFGKDKRSFVTYYFDDGMLIYVRSEEYVYNKPNTFTEEVARAAGDSVWYDDTKTRLEINQYFFDDNKLIKWTGPSAKDVPVNIADFTQKEPAIIAQALLALKQLKVE